MRDKDLGSTWADYVKAAREHAGLSRSALAAAAQVGRATVYRWESNEQRPERAEIVIRVADATGVDAGEALDAAGLRPVASTAPTRPRHQELPLEPDALYLLRRLADPDVSAEEKEFIRATFRRIAALAREQEEAERRLHDGRDAAAG